jgi:hypothetical protein
LAMVKRIAGKNQKQIERYVEILATAPIFGTLITHKKDPEWRSESLPTKLREHRGLGCGCAMKALGK